MRVGSGWSRCAGNRRDGERGGHRHRHRRRGGRPFLPRPLGRRRRQGRRHHRGHRRQDRPRPGPAVRSRRLGRRRLRRQDRPQRGRIGRPSRPTSWPRASSPRASSSSCSPAATTATPPARGRRSTSSALKAGAQQGQDAGRRRRDADARATRSGCKRWASTSPSTATPTRSRSCCTATPTRRSCAAPGSPTTSRSPISRPAPRPTEAADAQYAAQVQESALPSGRTTYRRLPDYQLELKQLAERLPGAGQADHAEVQDARGPRRHRHRDHPPPERQGRQAGVREHGRPSRPRVAVVGARDGVRLRPADQLRPLGADLRPRRHAPGRSSCRSSTSTASTSPVRRTPVPPEQLSALRPRVPAQELPARAGRDQQPGSPATCCSARRASTRTATTAASGAARARAPTRSATPTAARRRSPSPRSRTSRTCVGDAQRHQPDHQPHLLEPRPAPAGRPGRPGSRLEEPLYRELGGQLTDANAYANIPSSACTTRRAAPRTGRSGPRARWASRSRSGRELPSAVRDRRRRRVPRARAGRGRRPRRQPRGLLPDARGHGRPSVPLADPRHGAGRLHAADREGVPDVDLAGDPAERDGSARRSSSTTRSARRRRPRSGASRGA